MCKYICIIAQLLSWLGTSIVVWYSWILELVYNIQIYLNKKQESSFSIISPKLWNSLPHSIRSIVSDHTFKVKLKTYLFNIAYNN